MGDELLPRVIDGLLVIAIFAGQALIALWAA
jgi:hypothetical protein